MPFGRSTWPSLAGVLVLAAISIWALGARAAPAFDHAKHLPLFPGSCTTCHLGAREAGASFWPDPGRCAACHDGTVQPVIEWQPPPAPPPSNLRFTHERHQAATADSVDCVQCHTPPDPESGVARRVVTRCIDCHLPGSEHLALKNDRCATCHLPLAMAQGLTREDVSRFPVPSWHENQGFALGGHASAAEVLAPDGRRTVAPSCATCHARDFCIGCHVNAPEVAAIRALAPDPRSLVHRFTFAAPPSHQTTGFLTAHARMAARAPASCAACHTQPSCASCHVGASLPRAVTRMPLAGPGRAPGAQLSREPPASHGASFRDQHARDANAAPRTCATCHVRSDCLSCHRADVAQPSGGGDFHPGGFLVRHPAAAYARQTTCGDCHNYQQFCVSCHAQAGLNARRPLGSSSFHDGRASFLVGHGRSARQALESCVSCHVERDCTACHGAIGRGFGFNPHGPGFDPVRLRRRNPEMCIACHGQAIPGLP